MNTQNQPLRAAFVVMTLFAVGSIAVSDSGAQSTSVADAKRKRGASNESAGFTCAEPPSGSLAQHPSSDPEVAGRSWAR